MQYEAIIGLEVHVQLATKTKLFCRCQTAESDQPNYNVCPVCLGLPGALPVTNEMAVALAVKLGLATNCQIRLDSEFARKNYFYPDLPKGYQISQFARPICEKGWLDIEIGNKKKRINITRIHIEEDAGKLLHSDRQFSYVDLNRAGVPLVEIVSEPELRSAEEAKAYMTKIHSLVTYIGVSNGNMEKGNLRCDANISVRKLGDTKLNTRTETKNLNSFRFVQQAIDYEIARQIDADLDGEEIVQETRLFDSNAKKTFSMRLKEDSHDYRYFPCPDLPRVLLHQTYVDKLRQNLGELPDDKKQRFINDYELSDYDARLLTSDKAVADYFEQLVKLGAEPKKSANWMLGDFLSRLNEQRLSISQSLVKPQHLADLLLMIKEDKISGKIAKTVFEHMYKTGQEPQAIVAAQGLQQISDHSALQKIIDQLITDFPQEVKQYKSGKQRLIGFFVGKVMAATKGQANPKTVNQLLSARLND